MRLFLKGKIKFPSRLSFFICLTADSTTTWENFIWKLNIIMESTGNRIKIQFSTYYVKSKEQQDKLFLLFFYSTYLKTRSLFSRCLAKILIYFKNIFFQNYFFNQKRFCSIILHTKESILWTDFLNKCIIKL